MAGYRTVEARLATALQTHGSKVALENTSSTLHYGHLHVGAARATPKPEATVFNRKALVLSRLQNHVADTNGRVCICTYGFCCDEKPNRSESGAGRASENYSEIYMGTQLAQHGII